MPIATREDLATLLGVDALRTLLNRVVPAGASPEVAETARQKLLDAVLLRGDNFIAKHIDLPAPDQATAALRDIAIDQAKHELLVLSQGGESEEMRDQAKERRRELIEMRKRGNQMPGTTRGQASHRPRIVPAQGRYTTEVKKRYY
ncbi:MAG: hypothetical protein AAGC55_05630 [Myxococcota bacterium]